MFDYFRRKHKIICQTTLRKQKSVKSLMFTKEK